MPDGGWISTPLLRRSLAKEGAPRSADRDAPQAGHLEYGLIVFLALAAMLSFTWLAIRGPALLERISSWRPICSLVSCETQAHSEAQAEPGYQPQALPQPQAPLQPQALSQPQAPLQPQVQSQIQPRPQPPWYPPPRRPHMLDGVMAGECPPLRYWVHYSPRLREPQRRSPIECWRDRSIRGPCFD
jgi:hypothetical protein